MLKLYENIFFVGVLLTYIFIVSIIFGFGGNKIGDYLSILNFFMKIYICLLIIYRFNPFVKSSFTDFDKRLVFSSSIFLLYTVTIEEFFKYFDKANKFILLKD